MNILVAHKLHDKAKYYTQCTHTCKTEYLINFPGKGFLGNLGIDRSWADKRDSNIVLCVFYTHSFKPSLRTDVRTSWKPSRDTNDRHCCKASATNMQTTVQKKLNTWRANFDAEYDADKGAPKIAITYSV